MEESLQAARVLMGDSLGFHILFVIFSLTLPVLVVWFEYLGIRLKDNRYTDIAKFWSKIMALLVITGVISGTVVALQMSLIWPGILEFGGEVIGLPFMLETYAFLIEATFLSLYMLTWNNKHISQRTHLFFGIMTAIGANASAFAITSVSAWMNSPSGFEIVDGKLVNINIWEAMFSQTSILQFVHSMPGYFLAATLVVAGLYGIKLARVRKRDRVLKKHEMDRIIIRKLVGFAAILVVLSGITGHTIGQYLAEHEPTKLAALELHYETTDNAPFLIGGVAGENDTVTGPHIEVPGLLSFFSGNSTSTVVQGLNEVPKDEQPPLYIHVLFNLKLAFYMLIAAIVLGYYALARWRPNWAIHRGALISIGLAALMSVAVMELGWIVTEVGRQPWAVVGYLKTAEVITEHDVRVLGLAFPLAYVALTVATLIALRKIVRLHGKTKKGKA